MRVESIRSIFSVYQSAVGHAPRGGAKGGDLADVHRDLLFRCVGFLSLLPSVSVSGYFQLRRREEENLRSFSPGTGHPPTQRSYKGHRRSLPWKHAVISVQNLVPPTLKKQHLRPPPHPKDAPVRLIRTLTRSQPVWTKALHPRSVFSFDLKLLTRAHTHTHTTLTHTHHTHTHLNVWPNTPSNSV